MFKWIPGLVPKVTYRIDPTPTAKGYGNCELMGDSINPVP